MYNTFNNNSNEKHIHILRTLLIFICICFFVYACILTSYYIHNQSTQKINITHAPNKALNLVSQTLETKRQEILNIKAGKLLNDEQYEKIRHIYSNQSEKTVFLTFDDGPSKTVTPLILDLLREKHIKATFFVLGTNVEKNPDILKREFSEGHFIANHGYSHKYSEIYQSPETILNDYNLCEQAIRKVLNNSSFSCKVYRFPGGSSGGKYAEIKTQSKEILKQNHIAYLDWNALTYDAEGTPTKESILSNLKSTVGNKDVVVLLMHDSSSKILTYETLPEVINFFKDNGYTFKCLNDIL